MMTKIYTILWLLVGFAFPAMSQVVSDELDGNNINASLNNNGIFFHNNLDGSPGYEFPKGEENHLIYSQAFWFGGLDGGGGLRMASGSYSLDDSRDFFPGALTNDGAAEAIVPAYAGDIYVVSKAEIDYHVAHASDPGYEMPFGILAWPAHGDISMSMDFQLAPFADLNGNGIYEPETGEFPEIRGDHAAYLILNDKGGIHTASGGDPLGIEVHFMFYQYETTDDVNNTTFVNVRVINRSSINYPEFIVGSFLDFDIGFSEDDYVGCDSTNNVMYGYNADLTDEGGTGGQPGYGLNPPALGMVSLNNAMHVCGFFNRMDASPYNDPTSPADYWNYMNARWKNGQQFTYGGTGTDPLGVPTRYMYSGDPEEDTDDAIWNERTVSNPAGDRRVFMASEPVPFNAGEVRCYDYAIITSRVGDPFENASGVIAQAADVKAFYDAQPNTYCDFTLGLPQSEVKSAELKIYPNPSNGSFQIQAEGNFDVEIFALDGRLVFAQSNNSSLSTVQTNLADGTYLVVINQNSKTYQSKMVIRQ